MFDICFNLYLLPNLKATYLQNLSGKIILTAALYNTNIFRPFRERNVVMIWGCYGHNSSQIALWGIQKNGGCQRREWKVSLKAHSEMWAVSFLWWAVGALLCRPCFRSWVDIERFPFQSEPSNAHVWYTGETASDMRGKLNSQWAGTKWPPLKIHLKKTKKLRHLF